MTSSSKRKEWFEKAIKEKYIRNFKYNYFKDFEEIGSGGYGVVWKANYLGEYVALKELRNSQGDNNEDSDDDFIREVKNIIEIAPHGNIVQFLGVTQ
ncbi:24987_t:CDS:2, partial [Racocetra persica]